MQHAGSVHRRHIFALQECLCVLRFNFLEPGEERFRRPVCHALAEYVQVRVPACADIGEYPRFVNKAAVGKYEPGAIILPRLAVSVIRRQGQLPGHAEAVIQPDVFGGERVIGRQRHHHEATLREFSCKPVDFRFVFAVHEQRQ